MKKLICVAITVGLIFCISVLSYSQDSVKAKQQSKPTQKKETVVKEKQGEFPDSAKQEIKIRQSLLVRDSTSTK